MEKFAILLQRISCLLLLVCLGKIGNGQATSPQVLKLSDFAIWGGSSSATSYNIFEGVFIGEKALIKGNIGSNHLVFAKEKLTLNGNIFSGNGVLLKQSAKINGNITANKTALNCIEYVIGADIKSDFKGDITGKGKIFLKTGSGSNASFVRGKVAVPAPTKNYYSGPVPAGGSVNVFTLPVLPSMPTLTPFDKQAGTTNITSTKTISPGKFRKLALTGGKTLTFSGPGNYIFNEIDNGNTSNKFVFDFKNSTSGAINIFIVKDARMGKLSVSTKNGNFPSRIYTEVHGNGSTCGGFSFELQGPTSMPSANYVWLGNVWAPNAGISVKNLKTSSNPHIIGALWSAKKVQVTENLVLSYQAPAVGLSFIAPYYPPPPSGKVTVANNIIGAELLSLSQNPAPITSIPENEIFTLDKAAGKVMIEVISKTANDNTLKSQLATLGMTGIVDNGPHVFTITGFFPIGNLPQLNSNSRISYVRPLFPPLSNAGQVITQGDSTMRSYRVRERFGLDGSGVKIGVISDSYNSKLAAQSDVDQGDLPGIRTSGQPNNNPEPVQVVADLTKGGNDEGRAMLQIVHDVAPKSKLAFRTGFLTAGDFAKGIQELASPALPGGRCDVIVDDITYVTEPFLRDGVVAQAVDQAVAQGVTYFSSAGNFGNKSYEAVFNGITNTSVIPTGQIHRFGNTNADIYQTINLKPGTYTIVLQWSDEFHSLGSVAGVQTDLDMYLVGTNGFTLFGFNRSNLFGDPFEVCPFTVDEETNAKLMVVRASGTANVRFKYVIFRGEGTILDYQTGTSSIVGHPNANGAIAVGAMLYANFPAYTPVWPGVASFSSRGGTSVWQNNAFISRNKPDIIGPNGVNTTVNLGGASFKDGDDYPNFFGTSAAAPHVAGVAALLIQGRKKFNLQTTVTPAQIRQQLLSSAGKFSYLSGNFSFEGGYGYVQADSAMQQIANAKPVIDSLKTTTPGAQNGAQPFQVKIKGKYLTPSTQIYVSGSPVATTISADKTEATATVSAIPAGQNPSFQLSNAAKSPSTEDGGLSEPAYFFGSRKTVTVIAQNSTRKYGQANPSFVANVLINNVPINQTDITLADLKLDGSNLSYTTIATPASNAGLYGIFPSRTTTLTNEDPLNSQYTFTFISGTLTVEKMPLKITPQNKKIKYGEYPGDIVYNYEFAQLPQNASSLQEEVMTLHKKYLADNGLIVVNGFNEESTTITQADLINMSTLASFQSVYNARKFVLQNGQLKAMVNNIDDTEIGNQRFIVDVSANSLQKFKLNSTQTELVKAQTVPSVLNARGFLNVKALTNGSAKAALPNEELKPMVNGQLLAMVNGQLQALVNGQLKAMVNGVYVTAEDIVFQNGQLLALVNNEWTVVANGQLLAIVNGESVTVDLSVQVNGQLKAMVNGQLMAMVNGQLQAMVNGQLLAIVNGQLKAMVNGQLMPMVNGQLMAMVNGQLKAMVNGQLLAIVNGQLMAMENGELEIVQDITLSNGQLKAIVNGQLKAIVNGQLKAMVNGVITDVPTTTFNLVNGQLQAMVNGQLVAMVNGQLLAIVNGQLKAMVNGAAVAVESVKQLINGQLKAMVNGTYIPITNGQLQAIINGQLLAMVNGQLMAIVNGDLTFVVFREEELQVLINGQLKAMVNGQLKAMVNGQLQDVSSYSIVNGQLKAIVNSETWVYPNGQLKAIVNGQLQPLVNNFDVSGTNNNAKTMVLIDEDDISLQGGDIGGMFSINMITGLDAGIQTLIPGGFVNENYEVTYGLGQVEILPAPLIAKADSATKVYSEANPSFTISYGGFVYDEDNSDITPPVASSVADVLSNAGNYAITLANGNASNYTLILQNGNFTINKKSLLVKADDKTKIPGNPIPQLTVTYDGLAGDDTEDSVCIPFIIPRSPIEIQDLNRKTTYTNVKLNNGTNYINASPGQSITLTGNYSSAYSAIYNPDGSEYCPNCVTQTHVGMSDGSGVNVFTQCFPSNNELPVPNTGSINITFNAPAAPGVYYITQESTWWNYCGQFADKIHVNDTAKAIAIVVVNVSSTNVTASVAADFLSPAGNYPILLQGCNYYNPNYDVTLQNGTLSIENPCNYISGYVWEADGNFDDEMEEASATPVGGVTATGEAKNGSNSFAFDGTGYISTGTTGSVTGPGYFSVSAWVKTTSNNPMVVINQRDANADGEYILKIGGIHSYPYDPNPAGAIPGKAYFLVAGNGSNVADLISTTSVNDGNWHFIKGEREGTAVRLYVDGVLEASGNTSVVVDLNNDITTTIGRDARDDNAYFDGLIDDIRVSICYMTLRPAPPPITKSNPISITPALSKSLKDKLYPNPASSVIRLQLEDDVQNIKDIMIYDELGQLILSSSKKMNKGLYEINVSGLAKGMYVIRARTAAGIKTFKFTKM